ncbi:MAG: DEAD/DEAH box helicase, partial [Clostridia bacterium]|nr:DEAD/DEAH box helicase [Clostridia bacterium]
MNLTLSSPVQYVKGIGEKRAQLLKRMNVENVAQLLSLYPRAYEDRSVITQVSDINIAGEVYNLMLTVGESPRSVRISGGRQMISFRAYDDSGVIKIIFFNQVHLKDAFETGEVYRFRGKVTQSGGSLTLTSPTYEKADMPLDGIVPVYPLTAGISAKVMSTAIKNALLQIRFEEYLPPEIISEHSLMTLDLAIRTAHFPKNGAELEKAQARLSFDEFFLFSLSLLSIRKNTAALSTPVMREVNLSTLLSKLPYTLTDAQIKAVRDISDDFTGKKHPGKNLVPHMRRLLQGDVGSGKTIVAACAVFMAVRNGFRAAMMVPTEILARQHYNDMQPLFASLGIPVCVITGSTPATEKKRIAALLKTDVMESPMFIIGTHAILEDYLEIPRLGLIITDEQHRFGVNQRERLA